LPGGFGTLDELYEMLTWNQLSIHNKQIFILNTDGFYNNLLAHNIVMEQQGFLYDKLEDRIIVLENPQQLIPHLA
jgi:predicted Rossmann-fold nucleotide-binding protein